MVRKCKAMLVILGVLLPGVASALGLGELRLSSFLNEPLQAEVDLLDVGGLNEGQLKIRLASRADFDRAGVERAYFLTSMKFEAVLAEDGSGRLVITSFDPVLEPYLDFVVEARWPSGRILREYTVLLDLPALAGPDSGMTATAMVPAPTPIETAEAGSDEVKAATKTRYGTDAESEPGPGAKYLVSQDETLWSIARRARPEGGTVHQTMLDIQRLNPEAFIGGNINQMKAGYLLRLPNSSDISSSDLEEAVAVIEQHEQNWRENQAAIDARALDSQSAEGSGLGVEEEDQGRLQIAGVEESETGGGATAGADSASLEQLELARRDNSDLQTRISSMEDQMLTLQRLLTLKDDQIAALQSALGGEELETPAAIDEMEGTISEMPDPVSMIPVEEQDTVETPVVPNYSEPPVDDGLVGMLMDYILYIIALVVVLVGVAIWRFKDKLKLGAISRKLPRIGRRGAQPKSAGDADDEFAGVELGDDGLIVDEFSDLGEEDDSLSTDRLTFSDTDENAYAAQFETGDALAEADIYIAYGRFPQAVDLLKAAISVEPINVEYRVKLMEACIEMVDREEFQQQYADLQVLGDEAALKRGRELVEAADGGEQWLDDLPEPTITEEDVAAARAAASQASADAAEAQVQADDDGSEAEVVEVEDASDLDQALELDADLEIADDLDLDADLSAELDGELDGELNEELDLDLEDLGASLELGDEDSLDLGLEIDTNADEPDGLQQVETQASSADEAADIVEDDEGFDLSAMQELDSDEIVTEAVEQTPAEEDLDLDQFDMTNFAGEGTEDTAGSDVADADAGEDEVAELPDLELDAIPEAEQVEEELVLDNVTAAEDAQSVPEDSIDELDLSEFSAEAESAEGVDDADASNEIDLRAADDSELYLAEPPAELSGDDTDLMTDFGDLEIEGGEGFIMDDSVELNVDEDSEVNLEQSLDELTSSFEAEDEPADEAMVFAADGDEISTKLDLARAYMDMGDEEGAKSILEEVLQDGSDVQQQEAQTLIDNID